MEGYSLIFHTAQYFSLQFFFQKCSWGPEIGEGGGGGFWGVWANDTLLHLTMTRDRPKFWNGPPWRSKVIVRKPWLRNNKKIK